MEHNLSCATKSVHNSIETNKDMHMKTYQENSTTNCKNLNLKKKRKKQNLFLLCVLEFRNMKNETLESHYKNNPQTQKVKNPIHTTQGSNYT